MATPKSPKPLTPKQEAANENTSQGRLRELAQASTELARIVAKNPSAAPKLLRELGSSSDEITRKGVTTNPNTPSDVLLKLGAQFPGQLLDNPVFPLLILENPNLLASMPVATLRSLLKRDVVPEAFLEWAAGSSDEGVLLAVVMNPITPKSALKKLIQSRNTEVAEAAKLHVNWAGEMSEGWDEAALAAMKTTRLERNQDSEAKLWVVGAIPKIFLSVLHEDVRCRIANDPNTSADEFVELAKDNDRHSKVRLAQAQNPSIPLSLLNQLVGDNSQSVRETAAAQNPKTPFASLQQFQLQLGTVEHPHTDSDTLRELAASQWTHIRLGVAGHVNTPQDALDKLAKDQDPLVRMAVALNSNTSVPVLEYLSIDPEPSLRRAVGCHPNTPVSLLEQLAQDRHTYGARLAVAINLKTPLNLLLELAQAGDIHHQSFNWNLRSRTEKLPQMFLAQIPCDLKSLVSEIPTCMGIPENMRRSFFCLKEPPVTDNPDLLSQMANSPNSGTRRLVAMNPATPISALQHIAFEDDQWIQKTAIKTLTQNSKTPGEVLQQLVKKADRQVGVAIATHPNTPVAALEELANATDWFHLVVAKNPNTPVTVLEKLAREDNWKVREVVAQNSNTPAIALQKLLQDQNKYVREAAITNPNTPKNLLEQIEHLNSPETPQDRLAELATSQWLIIREAVALHPNTPVSILEELAKDKKSAVRLAVAQNPNTPGNILEQLVEDKDKEVAIAVAANPNTPVSILEELASMKMGNQQFQKAAAKNLMSQHPDKAIASLERYLKSFKPSFTRLLVFLNPLAPSSFLAKNFRSSSWLERYAIATNPNTPAHIRQRSQDGNRIVRAAAKAANLTLSA